MSSNLTLKQKLQNILSSEHRDELVWGLIQDLEMFIRVDREITAVVRSDKTDKEKVEQIKELVMFQE